jgi:SET domain-containing protein
MDLFIADCLYIDTTPEMGRGVFTNEDLEADCIIEISPVLIMSQEERKHLDQTKLHDYIFEWGPNLDQCCTAWGYVSLYNHKYSSNCEYYMDFERSVIMIKTVRSISAGEELYINYNGDWDNQTPLWFDAK